MIVLDTNTLSEFVRPAPDAAVVAWLDAELPTTVWTTAVTVYESRFGLARMPAGQRQRALSAAFDRAFATLLHGRVPNFDAAAAEVTATIMARCQSLGRPMDLRDAMIAGTVAAHGAALATRNIGHFADAGITLVDPWASTP